LRVSQINYYNTGIHRVIAADGSEVASKPVGLGSYAWHRTIFV